MAKTVDTHDDPMDRLLWDAQDVAKQLGVSRAQLGRLIESTQSETNPACRFPKAVPFSRRRNLWKRDAVIAWIDTWMKEHKDDQVLGINKAKKAG